MKKYGLVFLSLFAAFTACDSNSTVSENTFEVRGSDGAEAAAALVQGDFKSLGSPSELTVNVYASWLSPNEDCSDPVLVEDNGTTPVPYDLTAQPTLFAGSPGDGTYPCFILKISDQITFKGDAAAVADNPVCVDISTSHTMDVYREDVPQASWYLDMDGAPITARGTREAPVDDTIYLFATVNPAAYAATTGSAGDEATTIPASLEVPGSVRVTFNFQDMITTSNDNGGPDFCWAEGPEISFE